MKKPSHDKLYYIKAHYIMTAEGVAIIELPATEVIYDGEESGTAFPAPVKDSTSINVFSIEAYQTLWRFVDAEGNTYYVHPDDSMEA